MLAILIILVLLIGVYTGIKRGLIHQLVMSIGYVLSLWAASNFYEQIIYYVEMTIPYPSPFLPESNPFAFYSIDSLFDMHKPFYHILSFMLVFFAGWLITRFIGRLLRVVTEFRIDKKLDMIGGAVFSFIFHYIGIFFILLFLSTIPLEFIQSRLADSWLAEAIVINTPNLSNQAYRQFIERPIELNNTN